MNPTLQVAIVGAGFGGVGMGIALGKAGIDEFAIFEKSQAVGGCWHDNQYPGAACDVPSHLYSFSFEPKADWSRKFAPQPEILAYLEHCIAKYELARHVRLSSEVASAEFNEGERLWQITLSSGQTVRARALVTACGQLSRPFYPPLRGIEQFEGKAFHSARWDASHDLRGRRVAVIGSGASAIQIVPAIVDRVAHLYLFQRSAPYVIPKPDRAYRAWERRLFARVPQVQALSRAWMYCTHELRLLAFTGAPWLMRFAAREFQRHLEASVEDPVLRRRLTPDYPLGCKRILISNDFYPALTRPNAELVTEAIANLTRNGIQTSDGQTREVDTIIYATGFKTTEFLAPMRIRGLGGQDLNDTWRDGAQAYLGINVSGFPNLFMVYGPNTNLAHNSIIYMLESQIHYVTACLRELDRRNSRCLDVGRAAEFAYNAKLLADLRRTVWDQGCSSWYKTESGKNTNNWPGFTLSYRRRTKKPNFELYDFGA